MQFKKKLNRYAIMLSICMAGMVSSFACNQANANTLRDEARKLTNKQQYPAAIELYMQLISTFPADVDLLIETARVQGFADKNTDAALLYEHALKQAPQRWKDIAPSLAWQSLWAGRNQRATELFEELLEKGIQQTESSRGLLESHIAYARAYQKSGKHKQAISKFEQALNQQNPTLDLEAEFARALALGDENLRSATSYANLIKKYPARRNQWLTALAWQTLWSGNSQAALQLFSEAEDQALDLPESYRGHAKACNDLGLYDCAVSSWKKLIAARPDDVSAKLGLGLSLTWMDRPQAAIGIFESILKQNPTNREAQLGIAKALNFSGQHRAAIAHFEQLPDSKDEGQKISTAQAYYWAGFPEVAAKKLVDIKQKDAQWLRDYRISRETKKYLWGGFDLASNADKQQSLTTTTGLGWRRNERELLELTLRNVQSRAYDQPLQSAYIDLVRLDGNGVIDVMSNLTQSLQSALNTTQIAKMTEISGNLTGNLNDKFNTILANQKFPVSFGLGNLQNLLQSQNFSELRKIVASGDQIRLLAFLDSNQGRGLLSNLKDTLAQVKQFNPNLRTLQNSKEFMSSYTFRLGSAQSKAGTLWASLGLGARDNSGTTSAAWKLRARYIPFDLWVFDADLSNGVIDTLGASRNQVKYTNASVSAQYTVTPGMNLNATASKLKFDDQNIRNKLNWSADYLVLPKLGLRVGYEGSKFTDSKPWTETWLNRGYYNPAQSSENRLTASVQGEFKAWSYYAKFGLGRYTETATTESSSGRSAMAEGSISYNLNQGLELKANFGASNSAGSGNGGGYWQQHAGFFLTGWY